jgi:hypothetical protein
LRRKRAAEAKAWRKRQKARYWNPIGSGKIGGKLRQIHLLPILYHTQMKKSEKLDRKRLEKKRKSGRSSTNSEEKERKREMLSSVFS